MIRNKVDRKTKDLVNLTDNDIDDGLGNFYSGVISIFGHKESGVDWGDPVYGDMGSGPYYLFDAVSHEVNDLCLLNDASEELEGPIPLLRIQEIIDQAYTLVIELDNHDDQ